MLLIKRAIVNLFLGSVEIEGLGQDLGVLTHVRALGVLLLGEVVFHFMIVEGTDRRQISLEQVLSER